MDAIPAPLLALTLPVIAVNPEDRMDDIAADSDGADLLAAIAMGANQARALGADTAHLFGSGLPVCGALDMTRPGMLAADLTEVATFLRANGSLPDLTGFTIELEVG